MSKKMKSEMNKINAAKQFEKAQLQKHKSQHTRV